MKEEYLIQRTIHNSKIFKCEAGGVVYNSNPELEKTFVDIESRERYSIKSKVLSQEYILEKDRQD